MYQNLKRNSFLILVILLCFTSYSCKESQESADAVSTVVKINLLGVANNTADQNNAKKAKAGISSTAEETVQLGSVPFSKNGSFEVSLTKDASSVKSSSLKAATGKNAATTTELTPLDANVKYNVVVYDESGTYVTEKPYNNGSQNADGIALDAGKTYTFIVYSINSKESLPGVNNSSKLSEAQLEGIDADLMYFSSKMKLETGFNNLNVILKHQYSQIITRMTVDPTTTGNISSIVSPVITPSHVSANLKFSDGSITYNGLKQGGVNVVFPSLGAGTRAINSLPTLLIHPNEVAGILKFGSITIDGETKSDISIPALNIIPGQRYYLDLNFKTCTQDVKGGSDMNWKYSEVIQGGKPGIIVDGTFIPNGQVLEKSFTAPGADYGFVFDILQLDNSFNMEVNGVKLAKQEIQFQLKNAATAQNIVFADGSIFGGVNTENGGTVPTIYGMSGTEENPLVKVVISRTGEVLMFASKQSGGPLYPLVLSKSNTFNTFKWNGAGTNTVKMTQIVDGTTKITGSGSGKKKTSCNL